MAVTIDRPGRLRRCDVVLAGVLAVSTFVVHDTSYVLKQPFWYDETWVVVSTRLPLRDVFHVTSVTPVGWTVLLRAVAWGGEQRYRLLPLVFAALSVLAAYALGRSVPWRLPWWRSVGGTLAAVAVLLAPSSLGRDDLKPYTADAFLALTLLYLMSRLEEGWSRRRLVAFSATSVTAFLVSVASLFVSVAGFAALVLVCLARRDWRRTGESLTAGVLTGVLLGGLFLLVYLPHVGTDVTQYWVRYYLPVDDGLPASLDYLTRRGNEMAGYLGMGPLLVGLSLVGAGVVTLARCRRPAVAATVPVLIAEMVVLGALRKYPLFDARTSHFLTAATAAVAAVGVAGLTSLLARAHLAAGVAGAAAVTTLFVLGIRPDIRADTLPTEDVRSPVAYVAAHRQAKDIILVSSVANYGFGYYWPHGRPAWQPTSSGVRFRTFFPDDRQIVYGNGRDAPAVRAAFTGAVRRVRDRPGARLWVVLMHVNSLERAAWIAAIRRGSVAATAAIPCTLLVVTPVPAGAPSAPAAVRAARC